MAGGGLRARRPAGANLVVAADVDRPRVRTEGGLDVESLGLPALLGRVAAVWSPRAVDSAAEDPPMASRPRTIDEYLAALPARQREALGRLRQAIRTAAPQAEECISYGMPAFRQGRMLVAFAAAANHCSFFPMSGRTVAAHADLLARYDTSKGTIRFPPEKPLPAALVRRLVKARLAENLALGARPARPPAGGASGPAARKARRGAAPAGRPRRADRHEGGNA